MIPSAFGPRSVAAYFEELGTSKGPRQGLPIQQMPEFKAMVQAGMDPDTPVLLLGWIDDFKARQGLAARFAKPLKQSAPSLMKGKVEDNVFLYRAWKEVLGDYPLYIAQQIGDCTSFGSGHAVDLLQCVEITVDDKAMVYHETCTEAIYGIGREIAGMLGTSGDGCYGTAVAKALTDHGATTRTVIGPYDGKRAKAWGTKGVPADVKSTLPPFKVGSSALITDLDELDVSLSNGYPSAGGFSQGFTMHRNQNGMCQQSGQWGHEQCCIGKRVREGKKEYLLGQSWGPDTPDGPLSDDQPSFSFWIDDRAMASILSQRDWLAFSKAPTFEEREIPASWSYESYI